MEWSLTDTPVDLLNEKQWNDINVIAAAIKLYFRELVEPIFPFDLYDTLMTAVRMCPPALGAPRYSGADEADGKRCDALGVGVPPHAGLKQSDEQVAALRSIIQSLPAANYGVLKYLFMHLSRYGRGCHDPDGP